MVLRDGDDDGDDDAFVVKVARYLRAAAGMVAENLILLSSSELPQFSVGEGGMKRSFSYPLFILSLGNVVRRGKARKLIGGELGLLDFGSSSLFTFIFTLTGRGS